MKTKNILFCWLVLIGSLLAVLPAASAQESKKDDKIQFTDCVKRPDLCSSWGTAVANVKPDSFQIVDDHNRVTLTIKTTGEVIFGEGVKPSEAAKQFAEALKKLWPSMFECEKPGVAKP